MIRQKIKVWFRGLKQYSYRDLTGEMFGYWTVIDEAPKKKEGQRELRAWNCICRCGNKDIVYSGALISGHSKSCGCWESIIKRMRAEDLSGNKYSQWTVIKLHHRKKGQGFWECICDCGTKRIVNSARLKNGRSKSCGCYAIEKARNTCGKYSPHWNPNREQICAPYTPMFFDMSYREMIMRQQGYSCPTGEELTKSSHLHHIDFDKQNDDRYNLIFLCNSYHQKCKNTAEDINRIKSINDKIVMKIVSL